MSVVEEDSSLFEGNVLLSRFVVWGLDKKIDIHICKCVSFHGSAICNFWICIDC